MLRHVIGVGPFFAAIRAYVEEEDFRYDVADTDDMCASFEETTGIELSWFFNQWIYQPGFPHYEVGWGAQDTGGGYDVAVAITQVHEIGPVFKMPIDIDIVTYQGRESFVVWDSLPSQVFDLHVEGQPIAVVLDPNRWLIRQVLPMGIGDQEQLPTLSLAPNHPNPFRTETAIEYFLPSAVRLGIDVYDLGGRQVVRLLEGRRPAGYGSVVWNGTDAQGHPVAPGIYFCRLQTSEGSAFRRMLRIR
jgi:aminopeptidase N